MKFSAYAFNADRVKSSSDEQLYKLSNSAASARKGKAYLITIGVNASENPRMDLSYAANDARKIQTTLSPLLKKTSNFSEVVSVPLISENLAGKKVQKATKPIIKGIFSLLAGKREDVTDVNGNPVAVIKTVEYNFTIY